MKSFDKRKKSKRRHFKRVRKQMWLAQNEMCFYCERVLEESEITFDHLIPLNGRTVRWYPSDAGVVCCKKCNELKGNQVNVEQGFYKDLFYKKT